jgi:hypothetical protein
MTLSLFSFPNFPIPLTIAFFYVVHGLFFEFCSSLGDVDIMFYISRKLKRPMHIWDYIINLHNVVHFNYKLIDDSRLDRCEKLNIFLKA